MSLRQDGWPLVVAARRFCEERETKTGCHAYFAIFILNLNFHFVGKIARDDFGKWISFQSSASFKDISKRAHHVLLRFASAWCFSFWFFVGTWACSASVLDPEWCRLRHISGRWTWIWTMLGSCPKPTGGNQLMITEEQARGPTVLATRVIHNLRAEDQGSGFPGSMALRHGGICAKT